MKRTYRHGAAAMIIGMTLLLPPMMPAAWAQGVKMPDPVVFANRMELGDVAQAREWLAHGLPPDFQGSRIGSGLMIGAWEGKTELMAEFLAHGADIDKSNSNGETALALAALRGHGEVVKWLLDRGARINGGPRSWTALHYAAFGGHRELVDSLLARGADINAQSPNGSSPLMMATYDGHDEVARHLISRGANRGIRNDWGDGAFEWAMRQNRTAIAEALGNPEEFAQAMSKPREHWGPPQRSMRSSRELDLLLTMRDNLRQRGSSLEAIDRRIAAERARIVRAEMGRPAAPRAAALEVTASRNAPGQQSTQLVYDEKGRAIGFKAPETTYVGKPKMPPKGNVKNY